MTAAAGALPDLARNRFLQKKALAACGIPMAEFRLARNHRELVVAHKALGFPGLLKLQFVDEERSGPWPVHDFDDVPKVLRQTNGRPLLWERLVSVDRAFSLEVERAADGSLHLGPEMSGLPRTYAATIGERLGIVGSFLVTFVASGDRLLVDEVDWSPNAC